VLGQLGNVAHPSGESGEGGPHQMNEIYDEVWSARGEWRWEQRPGVVIDSSWCGEVVLGGAVLGVWSTRPKTGWSGLSVVVCINRGGVAVRGRRGCRGWSWKGCRGAPVRGGARGGGGRAEGGRRRRHLVDQGAAVGIDTA
jgi:hypothetical protein